MKALFLVGAAALLVATMFMMHSSHHEEANDHMFKSWEMWKEMHNKRYDSKQEESYRY